MSRAPAGRPQFRPAPGTRPLAPVRLDEIPDDWKCTWVVVEAVWSASGPCERFWVLKYVNSSCGAHNKLAVL